MVAPARTNASGARAARSAHCAIVRAHPPCRPPTRASTSRRETTTSKFKLVRVHPRLRRDSTLVTPKRRSIVNTDDRKDTSSKCAPMLEPTFPTRISKRTPRAPPSRARVFFCCFFCMRARRASRVASRRVVSPRPARPYGDRTVALA